MANKDIQEKTTERRVYGLILESQETVFLSIQFTYSLEEAFLLAKLEFEKLNPHRRGENNPLVGAKIGLFTVKTLSELTSQKRLAALENITPDEARKMLDGISALMSAEEKNPTPNEVLDTPQEKTIELHPRKKKNHLMQQIIKDKDETMFKKHKDLFSKAEKSYLKAHLK